jgi:hypothetical protein
MLATPSTETDFAQTKALAILGVHLVVRLGRPSSTTWSRDAGAEVEGLGKLLLLRSNPVLKGNVSLSSQKGPEVSSVIGKPVTRSK